MIKDIIEYTLSPQHKLSHKLTIFITGCILLLSLDYFFRFSDSYITHSKLDQIEKIQNLLKNDSLDSNVKSELYNLQIEVINRTTFWSAMSSFCSVTKRNLISLLTDGNKDTPERNLIYHLISSSWVFIVLMVIQLMNLTKIKTELSLPHIMRLLLSEILLVIMVFISTYILAMLPIVFSPYVNYGLNAVLIFLLVSISYYISLKEKSAKLKQA